MYRLVFIFFINYIDETIFLIIYLYIYTIYNTYIYMCKLHNYTYMLYDIYIYKCRYSYNLICTVVPYKNNIIIIICVTNFNISYHKTYFLYFVIIHIFLSQI